MPEILADQEAEYQREKKAAKKEKKKRARDQLDPSGASTGLDTKRRTSKLKYFNFCFAPKSNRFAALDISLVSKKI